MADLTKDQISQNKERRAQTKFDQQQADRIRKLNLQSQAKQTKDQRKSLYKTLQKPSMLSPLKLTGERVQRRFRRATSGAGELLGAFGVQYKAQAPQAAGARRYAGPGRPRGTYKYEVPIQDYKKLQAQRKAVFRLQAQKKAEELYAKGYTPEQVRQIQINEMANAQMQQQNLTPEEIQNKYNEDLQKEMISPNTQMMLDRIKWIQTKGARDNANMQRVVRERRIINKATDILKTPSIFGPESNTINIFDDEINILKAPNLFVANPNNSIMKKRSMFSILDTAQAGNNLKW